MLSKRSWLNISGALAILVTICLTLFVNTSDVKKIDLLSGNGIPGEKWQKQDHTGQSEFVEFVSGNPKTNPLRGAPSTHIKHNARNTQGEKVFDVDYFYDSFGRRIVDENKNAKSKQQKFALFFGCADLLGIGLNSIDTTPTIFSMKIPEYRSYNYGFPVASVPYVNKMIETIDFNAEVTEKKGLFIYVITKGHYPGSVEKIFQTTFDGSPRYRFESKKNNYFGNSEEAPDFLSEFESKKIKYVGTAEELSPFIFNFKKHLSVSAISALVSSNRTIDYTPQEHRFICSLIKNAQVGFLNKFPDSRFIILLHKLLPEFDREKLRNCARVAKVEFVDAFTPNAPNAFSTYPPYFYSTRFANEVIVDKLVAYLNQPRKF